MKTIVTHMSPDLDAIASIWLIRRFLPGWEDSQTVTVASGSLWNSIAVDSDPDALYVDTGLGKFDHHQTTEKTSAAKKVFTYLLHKGFIPSKSEEGLARLIKLMVELDHFSEVDYPDPASDRYDLCLHQLIGTLKYIVGSDTRVIETTLPFLDSALALFSNKVSAEKQISEGFIFKSAWGKSIVLLTDNKEAMKLAQKKGFQLVVTKDKAKGYVRIKIPPTVQKDLEELYQKILQKDPKAYWYFHVSKHMLLNDSTQRPDSNPSTLSPSQLIALIKEI